MSKRGENIYRRKDGRWEARYKKGRRQDGTICYGYCYGKTYREAKEKSIRASTETRNAQRQRRTCGLVADYCDEWFCLKRSCIRESTYIKYETILEKYIKPELGAYFAESLSQLRIEQFSYGLLHESNLSVKTVRDILTILHSVLEYALGQNPDMRPIAIVYPKEQQKARRVLTREEQSGFAEYLLKEMDACKFGVLLAMLTGLRIGEICALKWSDISLPDRTVSVSRTMQRIKNVAQTKNAKTRITVSVPKSRMSERLIPLNEYVEKLCQKWQVQDSEAYVLTGTRDRYLEPRTLQYRIQHYTTECGLEGVHFHTLRHSFATRCIEAGFEIKSLSEILGHSTTKITLDCYVHSSMRLKRENMERLNNVLDYMPSECAVKQDNNA